MQKNYSKRYLLKAKQTLKRTRPSGEEGKQRTDHERRPREDDERDATPQRDAAPSIGSAWERHRREGVNEEGETSGVVHKRICWVSPKSKGRSKKIPKRKGVR